jgi:hypothetical protein
MEGTKALWASKTVWGSVAVLIVAITQVLGYDIGDASGWTDGIIAIIGSGLAIYGRIKAVKKIVK